MNGRKKPRVPRWPARLDTISLATGRAGKLFGYEVNHIIGQTNVGMNALREGRATEHDWSMVAGMLNAALHVNAGGVAVVLDDVLEDAEAIVNALWQRATTTGTWRAPILRGPEIEAIQTAIRAHKWQLQQLSQGEALAALQHAEANVRRQGGLVTKGTQRMTQGATA